MDSGEVVNLLENQDQISKKLYQLHEDGDYQLTVSANDEVGNELGEVTYKMAVNSEKISVTAPESMVNPLIYVGIAAVAALCTLLIDQRRLRSADAQLQSPQICTCRGVSVNNRQTRPAKLCEDNPCQGLSICHGHHARN